MKFKFHIALLMRTFDFTPLKKSNLIKQTIVCGLVQGLVLNL